MSTTGTLSVGETTVTGKLTSDSADVGTLSLTGTVNGAVISTSSGEMSFGDNNITTTGNLSVKSATLSGDLIVGTTTIKESELGLIDGLTTLGYSQDGKVLTQNNQGNINIGSITGGEVLDIISHNGTNAGLKLGGVLVTATSAKINNVNDTTGPIGSSIALKIDESVAQSRYALKTGRTTFGSVGALSVGSIINGFTKIEMEGPISTTGSLTSGSMQVDNVTMNGANIGFKQNTTVKSDLVTLYATQVAVDGVLKANNIVIGNVAITADANEINKLDGVTSNTVELSLLKGSQAGLVNSGSAVVYGANGEVVATTVTWSGIATAASGSKLGKVTVTDTSITTSDPAGQISFNTNNLETSGTVNTGALTATSVTSGDVTINGNLTVTGTQSIINTENISSKDPLMVLSSETTASASADAGFIVERGTDKNVGIIWDESSYHFALVNTDEAGTTSGDVTID